MRTSVSNRENDMLSIPFFGAVAYIRERLCKKCFSSVSPVVGQLGSRGCTDEWFNLRAILALAPGGGVKKGGW